MTSFRTIIITMAAAATLLLAAALPSLAATGKDMDCLSDQQIQAAIAAGQIKSWPKIKKLAQISADYQEVSDVKVCLIDGVPYYTVNLVSSNGAAAKFVLNAVDGTS